MKACIGLLAGIALSCVLGAAESVIRRLERQYDLATGDGRRDLDAEGRERLPAGDPYGRPKIPVNRVN